MWGPIWGSQAFSGKSNLPVFWQLGRFMHFGTVDLKLWKFIWRSCGGGMHNRVGYVKIQWGHLSRCMWAEKKKILVKNDHFFENFFQFFQFSPIFRPSKTHSCRQTILKSDFTSCGWIPKQYFIFEKIFLPSNFRFFFFFFQNFSY